MYWIWTRQFRYKDDRRKTIELRSLLHLYQRQAQGLPDNARRRHKVQYRGLCADSGTPVASRDKCVTWLSHARTTCTRVTRRRGPATPIGTFETSQSWHVAASGQRAASAMHTSQHRVIVAMVQHASVRVGHDGSLSQNLHTAPLPPYITHRQTQRTNTLGMGET